MIENKVDHGNDEEFFSDRCFEEEEHVWVTKATVNYGRNDRTTVTELCLSCNIKLRTWDEYPDDFTF